jgi:hypothetical protein
MKKKYKFQNRHNKQLTKKENIKNVGMIFDGHSEWQFSVCEYLVHVVVDGAVLLEGTWIIRVHCLPEC